MSSAELALAKRKDVAGYYCKEGCCQRIEALEKQKEEIEAENEKLREIFTFAAGKFEQKEKEIASLHYQLQVAYRKIDELSEENERLRSKVEQLQGTVKELQKTAFGNKSEKSKEMAAGIGQGKKRGAKQNHKGSGRKLPLNLPKVEQLIELPQDQRFCPCCGLPYEETGLYETSSEVSVQTIYYLKIIKRKIYKATCRCAKTLVCAPTPAKLIPKGKFSNDFLINVLANKYQNHLPIQRQIADMKEYGLIVSSGSIFGALKNLYFLYLQPLYCALAQQLRKAYRLHADESGWHLFAKFDAKGNYRWFIWVFVCPQAVLFVLAPHRSAVVPAKVLFNLNAKQLQLLNNTPYDGEKRILSSDRFSAYKLLERLGLVELAFCWAHQRRDFIKLKTKYPALQPWADEWIERIGDLYHINNERIKYNAHEPAFHACQLQLQQAIDNIHSLIYKDYQHPQQVALMQSMQEHWKGLTLFVEHSDVPMDNNVAERMLRPMVLGRNNYWGNHSLWAGHLSTAMFSIIQTCLMHKVSPRAYLAFYFNECLKRGAAPPDNELILLLPHNLDQQTKAMLQTYR